MDPLVTYATKDPLRVHQDVGLGRVIVEHVSGLPESAKPALGSLESPVDPEKLPRLFRVQRHASLYHAT